MKTHKAKWWELNFPDAWESASTRDDVRFKLASGTEVIITSLCKQQGDVLPTDMRNYAHHVLVSGAEEQSAKIGIFRGISVRVPDGYAESMYLCHASLMLVILCNYERRQKDQDQKDIYATLSGIKPLKSDGKP